MRRIRRLTLLAACLASIGLCALLLAQSAGVVPPVGVGWGDGTRARAYSVEAAGPLVLRTASGMKPAPPGSYEYAVQSLSRSDGFGISYHRWNMTAGRAAPAPVLGTFAELRISPGWPALISLILLSLFARLVLTHRRAARKATRCRECGYDLRATPERCPECGSVPAARPAA